MADDLPMQITSSMLLPWWTLTGYVRTPQVHRFEILTRSFWGTILDYGCLIASYRPDCRTFCTTVPLPDMISVTEGQCTPGKKHSFILITTELMITLRIISIAWSLPLQSKIANFRNFWQEIDIFTTSRTYLYGYVHQYLLFELATNQTKISLVEEQIK